ncbi:MAG TPA: branched-chain amino acid ABC transporter permease [Desulfomonilaceae bacterium]|nr:branched-chain amino acid ABC transporter permease [Desulfomonilaceae bacterium]
MENKKNYKAASFWALFIVIFAAVPLVKTSDYQLMLANHILLWGMFAVAFNMLFGLTGMLSFGQALYYGLGAYAVGMTVRYMGEAWFLPAIGAGLVAAIILSILVGLLTIRLSGVFFTVLTLAFGQLVWQIVFTCYHITGGDDGIQGIIPPGVLSNRVVYYYFALALVLVSLWCLRRLVDSPMGLLLRCIRQNPERVRFVGGQVRRNQLRIYMISSFFAALAGALMAGVDNSIHPDMLYWTTSGEVILMAVLGGIGRFFGPFIGAAVIIVIGEVVGARTEFWPLIIGLVMMVMVLLLPRGLAGEFQLLRARLASATNGNRG